MTFEDVEKFVTRNFMIFFNKLIQISTENRQILKLFVKRKLSIFFQPRQHGKATFSLSFRKVFFWSPHEKERQNQIMRRQLKSH